MSSEPRHADAPGVPVASPRIASSVGPDARRPADAEEHAEDHRARRRSRSAASARATSRLRKVEDGQPPREEQPEHDGDRPEDDLEHPLVGVAQRRAPSPPKIVPERHVDEGEAERRRPCAPATGPAGAVLASGRHGLDARRARRGRRRSPARAAARTARRTTRAPRRTRSGPRRAPSHGGPSWLTDAISIDSLDPTCAPRRSSRRVRRAPRRPPPARACGAARRWRRGPAPRRRRRSRRRSPRPASTAWSSPSRSFTSRTSHP